MKIFASLFLILSSFMVAQKGDEELVNIKELIPDVKLDIRYSTTDNFTSQKLYTTNEALFMLKAVNMLKTAASNLRSLRTYDGKSYPKGIGIKVFDAYRPRAIQYLMFEIFPNPTYVADPANGSIHNFGGAIDLTLYDIESGIDLQMPTEFDFFGPEAGHGYSNLPPEAIANRALLKSTMESAGFSIYSAEWWHYQIPNGRASQILDFQMK
ncbi:MAG: M15 family metallopeptidase [Bacteroidetes bacterium]|nr:M15 family metallopeptidase [Bacteroidota bacterium]MBU2508548.1 M15 family metallopeptidase [Bacteroidota bacterium]